MSGILGYHRVDCAAQQAAPGDGRQIMGDEDEARLPSRVGDSLRDSPGSSAGVVHADQISMIGEQPRGEGFADVIADRLPQPG